MRSNPWRDMDDVIMRADSPTGLRERALDALELVPDVPTASRQRIGELLSPGDNGDEYATAQSRATAEYVLAAADPSYLKAFRKIIQNPQHGFLSWTEQERAAFARTQSVRTAMSLTSANGGYLVPFTLDPTIVLTNTGAMNPYRDLATVKTTATNTWNGVTSAGVNAGWLAEGTEDSDHTPTFRNLQITPQKASAWIYGSYEVLEDSDFASQLTGLLADAKDRLEEAAFTTGTGSGQPKGVVTAAVAASKTVNTAAVATYAQADVYNLLAAVPARWNARASVVMNPSTGLKTRQFDTAGGSAFWANLGDAQPERILGRKYRESSTMVATYTTTGS